MAADAAEAEAVTGTAAGMKGMTAETVTGTENVIEGDIKTGDTAAGTETGITGMMTEIIAMQRSAAAIERGTGKIVRRMIDTAAAGAGARMTGVDVTSGMPEMQIRVHQQKRQQQTGSIKMQQQAQQQVLLLLQMVLLVPLVMRRKLPTS